MGQREMEEERERQRRKSPRERERELAMRLREEEEIENEDAPTTYDLEAEMLETLERIEKARATLHSAAAYFKELLEEYPFLAEIWEEFQKIGGVSAYDLERHLNGKIIRHRRIPQRGHMRLIASQAKRPVAIRRSHGNDDAA